MRLPQLSEDPSLKKKKEQRAAPRGLWQEGRREKFCHPSLPGFWGICHPGPLGMTLVWVNPFVVAAPTREHFQTSQKRNGRLGPQHSIIQDPLTPLFFLPTPAQVMNQAAHDTNVLKSCTYILRKTICFMPIVSSEDMPVKKA